MINNTSWRSQHPENSEVLIFFLEKLPNCLLSTNRTVIILKTINSSQRLVSFFELLVFF